MFFWFSWLIVFSSYEYLCPKIRNSIVVLFNNKFEIIYIKQLATNITCDENLRTYDFSLLEKQC